MVHQRSDIFFRCGDRCNTIIFHQIVQNIRRQKRRKRRAKTDVFDTQDAEGLIECRRPSVHTSDRMKESGSSFTEHPKASQVSRQPGLRHKHHYTAPYPSVVADHRFLPDRDH